MSQTTEKTTALAHIAPFAWWIVVMLLPGSDQPWNYALRIGGAVAALLIGRPWRGYGRLKGRAIPAGLLVGGLVFVIWVAFESAMVQRLLPGLSDLYLRYAVLPWGEAPTDSGGAFDLASVGWGIVLMRLAGSAIVVALVEEFFWRGFVYRAVVSAPFSNADMHRVHWGPMLITATLFGLADQKLPDAHAPRAPCRIESPFRR